MPEITVMADRATNQGHGIVMLRERVSPADFESGHFQTQLVERLGWAVGDAAEVEDGELDSGAGARAAYPAPQPMSSIAQSD